MHLYIHVPFCARRCSYCDFAIAVRREVPSAAYRTALEREWQRRQADSAWQESTRIETIYFGGGTPSRLDPDSVAALLRRFRHDRELAPGAEVTLEANPEDVSDSSAAAWAAAGVNRVSLGAQSFSPAALVWMHRTHTAAQIGAAVRALRSAGIENISLDFIYALPDALRRDWSADLEQALALEPQHLSLYGLTVESGTPLGRWTARGDTVPAADQRAAEEFLAAHQRLAEAGFEHYEVSNAALPGFRARHNSAYWQRKPFLGLGPAAHSASADSRAWNVREWAEYHRLSEAGQEVRAESESLNAEQVALEQLYLGLRTTDGVEATRIPAETRRRWITHGWAVRERKRLRLSPEGWLRLDALVASLTHC